MNYKLTLYGEYGVGKTSLTRRLVHNNFDDNSQSTIGASFTSWKPNLDQPTKISFGIWDTAGQERYSTLLPMYLRNADAVFYCWDYNIPFNHVIAYTNYTKAKEYNSDCLFYLVLTKIDMRSCAPADDAGLLPDSGLGTSGEAACSQSLAEQSSGEAESFVKDNNIDGIFYTSSLTGAGVQDLFIATAKKLLKTPKTKISDTLLLNRQQPSRNCCIFL
uniref:Ras-related GTPase n=1 Tax=Marseillevirus LCMAC201 TaxID=2506605 RepID=A0A481YWW1_9VIRU|nr:MAG: Ras-related GTPase [Marseillevirus LCMAC201]